MWIQTKPQISSSIASPICQEGQSERTFLMFPLFLDFSPDFSFLFHNFSLFFPIFDIFYPILATPLQISWNNYKVWTTKLQEFLQNFDILVMHAWIWELQ